MRHIISATAVTVVATGATEQLAMCGARLGAYSAATAAGHIVGNYTPAATAVRLTSCPQCASRMGTYITDARVRGELR